MTVSTSGMVVSLEPESRFPMSGHEGHDGRNTHLVAGKYDVEGAFLVVSPVHQVEEQSGIFFIKHTVAYFVDNQT